MTGAVQMTAIVVRELMQGPRTTRGLLSRICVEEKASKRARRTRTAVEYCVQVLHDTGVIEQDGTEIAGNGFLVARYKLKEWPSAF